MRTTWIVVFAAVAVACSSKTGSGETSGPDSIDGSWVETNSAGTGGFGAVFNSDGTYTFTVLQLTSSKSANVEGENGTFTVSGNTITTTPKQWSCTGPYPVYQTTYSFQGDDLTLTQPAGAVVLQPNTAAATSVAITFGCFNNGVFAPQPLAAVSN